MHADIFFILMLTFPGRFFTMWSILSTCPKMLFIIERRRLVRDTAPTYAYTAASIPMVVIIWRRTSFKLNPSLLLPAYRVI